MRSHGTIFVIYCMKSVLFIMLSFHLGPGRPLALPTSVVRYHSLMVDDTTLPEDLVPTAWTVAESGLVALDGWQDGEGELSWEGRGGAKFRSTFPKVKAVGQFHHENANILMGVSHRSWPHHGVQFHPESLATAYGRQILENFRNITVKFWVDQPWQPKAVVNKKTMSRGPLARSHTFIRDNQPGPVSPFLVDPSLHQNGKGESDMNHDNCNSITKENDMFDEMICKPIIAPGDPLNTAEDLRLHWQKLSGFAARVGGSRTIFCKLFGDEAVEDTFWLDSSTREQGRARFSFMGGRGGCLWQRITYQIAPEKESDSQCGILRVRNAAGQVKETILKEGFLDLLNRELELRRCRTEDYANLPFDFCGGFIGYLGYELKIGCGAESNKHISPIPDAGMFLVDRVVAIDHSNDDVYVMALFQDGITLPSPEKVKNCPDDSVTYNGGLSSSRQETIGIHAVDDTQERFLNVPSLLVCNDGSTNGQTRLLGDGRCSRRVAAEAWVEDIVRKVNYLVQQGLHKASERMHLVSLVSSVQTTEETVCPPFIAEKSRAGYIRDVKRCQELIKDGESYEVCLTTQLRRKSSVLDCFGFYLTLRETNPAPYSAWLHFGKDGPCICSSSPERFLRLDRQGILEAKPIKGTIARGNNPVEDERLKHELQHSEKDQAENLMIVDLLRNDLGRVCEPGTIHVPSLMAVESYSTVHTLVSTVKGRKRTDVTPVNCVRAAFPGGSMTGAPKLRTMEIIDCLESSPRGVYSGTVGYFSFNSSFDLNIVIRTLVFHEGESSLGAGGAVIALSDPEAEYEEMLLKTKAPITAVSNFESDLKLRNAADRRGPVIS